MPIRTRRNRASASSLRPLKSTPSTLTRPELGRSNPPSTIINVDFPEPDGPTMLTVSLAPPAFEPDPAENIDGTGSAPQCYVDIVQHHERAAGMKRGGHTPSEPVR